VALLLAKAGVGEIRLVDDDVLLPGNVARHTCGLKWIGFDKTYAMKKVILEHNPDCEVSCFDSTWGLEELRGYFNGCDVVIDTTANRNFSLYLNQICVESDQPTILAAAYRRAAVGRILIHRGDQDPCLACYSDANKFWSEDQYPTIPLDPDEAFIEDGCGVVTEEAVALDVEAVANLTTRIAIRLMRGQLDGKNIAILVNEPLAGASGILGQEGIHWWTNNPLPACRICCEEDPDLL
jgi:molybdopterin/thiamine biosynthesis adenylyltransferase